MIMMLEWKDSEDYLLMHGKKRLVDLQTAYETEVL